ncbi:MAG: hypothetical protein PHY08_10745 [Candidatus Cloacimonetes bacterium]|nr:hypothetical protein [Candidatus Cloacimonadota bacterium]
MNEKKLKFKELAEKRVNSTIKSIQLIGNLSNTRAYNYTDEEVKKIFKILKEEISIAEFKFKNKGVTKNFKL